MIKVGVVGLGRLGIIHAENIAFKVKGAKLSALCDINFDLVTHMQKQLGADWVYDDFEALITGGKINAVVIVSPSSFHCQQIEMALEAGLDVFCEKPLGVSQIDSLQAQAAVETHPDKVFMLGFMRRFDDSYRYAKRKVDLGEIGRPILFRSYSVDPESAISSVIPYIPHSAGQFIDMAVHDIDLARWFLKCEPKTIYAIGGCYKHPEFGAHNDGDNVSALMQFENDTMVFILAGRTAPHGYNVETEIIGTEGSLRIGSVPQKNLVEILDNSGVRKECMQTFPERFNRAFVSEIQEFINCIKENRRPEISVVDGVRSSYIAEMATKSFLSNELVRC